MNYRWKSAYMFRRLSNIYTRHIICFIDIYTTHFQHQYYKLFQRYLNFNTYVYDSSIFRLKLIVIYLKFNGESLIHTCIYNVFGLENKSNKTLWQIHIYYLPMFQICLGLCLNIRFFVIISVVSLSGHLSYIRYEMYMSLFRSRTYFFLSCSKSLSLSFSSRHI